MNVHSAGLFAFNSYEQAKNHHDFVIPYRAGNSKGMRPIGNRRYKQCIIEKHDNDSVCLLLNDSPVVTFFPNGEIHVSLCKWDTITTRQFINATTNFTVDREKGATVFRFKGKNFMFKNHETPIIIKGDVVENSEAAVIHKLDRKKFNQLRNNYSEFISYVRAMGSISAGITNDEVCNAEKVLFGPNPKGSLKHSPLDETITPRFYRPGVHPQMVIPLPDTREFWFAGVTAIQKVRTKLELFLRSVFVAQEQNDLELMYALYVLLGRSCLRYLNGANVYVRDYAYVYSASAYKIDTKIDGSMLSYFDEVVKYVHATDLFTAVHLPLGEAKADQNRKYFAK